MDGVQSRQSGTLRHGQVDGEYTEMVRWMCEHGDEDMDAGIPCAMQIAVGYGNMQALRILLERRQITDDFRRLLCPYAAEGGHVEIGRYAIHEMVVVHSASVRARLLAASAASGGGAEAVREV